MDVLCASLLSWAVKLTDYERPPDGCPEVIVVEQEWLQKRFCGGSDCPVAGGYLGGDKVYIINIDMGNPLNRSVLLHELVHYLQWRDGRIDFTDCEQRLRNEREAYRAQTEYLTHYGQRAVGMHMHTCPREPANG